MKNNRIAITALTLFVAGFAQADSISGNHDRALFVSPGPQVLIPRDDCWIEHTQVQPARLPDASTSGNPRGDGAIAWARSGKFAGSEHWNVALRRACKSSPSMTGKSPFKESYDYLSQ